MKKKVNKIKGEQIILRKTRLHSMETSLQFMHFFDLNTNHFPQSWALKLELVLSYSPTCSFHMLQV